MIAAEHLAQVGQRIGKLDDLEIVVNVLPGEELGLDRLEARLGVFSQPFHIWFLALVPGTDESTGNGEQLTEETSPSFESGIGAEQLRTHALDTGDLAPRVADFLLELFIVVDEGAE